MLEIDSRSRMKKELIIGHVTKLFKCDLLIFSRIDFQHYGP